MHKDSAKKEWPSVCDELIAKLGVKPGKGETPASFAFRLAQTANDDKQTPEDVWNSLSEDVAQTWCNDFLRAWWNYNAPGKTADSTTMAERLDAASDGKLELPPLEGNPLADGKVVPLKAKPAPKKAAPKKEAPKQAAPKPEKKPTGSGVPIFSRGALAPDAKITVLAKKNPHEAGSRKAEAFSKLKSGMTVKEAYGKGVKWTNLVWDESKGYLRIS